MMHDLFGNSLIVAEPLGVPYMGSKRKYANQLICKMLEQKPHCKYFYDLFGGGGAMSFAALQKGMTVFYNEKQTDLVNLIEFIFECMKEPKSEYGLFPAEWYKFVTREEFIKLRTESGNYAQFVRICYSFGNNQRTYLFNPELEVKKHLAHDVVVFRDSVALERLNDILKSKITISSLKTLNDRRLSFVSFVTSERKRLDLQQLERLQQLEQLERLEQLQQLQQKITFANLDYRDVQITTPIEETIVYFDPPYRKTEKYIEGLNHDELDKYFAELPYLAFMSEYNAPFQCINEIKTRSTLSSSNNTCERIEKLFVNKL